ncbi:MAG: hypothetical protein ACODAD_00840 [Planctomycetota bacterium]
MRKSLGTLSLILLVFSLIGLYRNWFALDRQREGNTTEVHLRIDRAKIRDDTRQAAEVAREFGSNVEVRVKENGEEETQEETQAEAQEGEPVPQEMPEQWR